MNQRVTAPEPGSVATRASEPAVPAIPRLRLGRLHALLLIVLLSLLGCGWWLYQQFTHVYVTDARVAADMITLSSRVPGWVVAIEAIEGEPMRRGALLVRIDDRESRLQLHELDARLARLLSRRRELEARIAMTDLRSQSLILARQAAVRAAQTALVAAQAQEELARAEQIRAEALSHSGAVARAELDKNRTALETARQQVFSAQAQLENARAALAQAEAERHELTVLERQLAALEPEEEELRAQRQRAQLDLDDRTIVMPFDGVVDRVFVDVGEYVTPGQRLLMVHDPARIRIEANVKETEIRHFHPGKTVTVTVDALPGRRFEGTVERVGQAATSEFALLPNPNPSGNFTKITQRLPVRIAIPQEDGQLKPGMMVEVEARIRG